MIKPLSGYIWLGIHMHLHVYGNVMVFVLVILRITTGPYGRPMLEVAYREMLCSLHWGCMGVDSSGRVVGVSTWCRPCWTYPGQHQCGLTVYRFFYFHTLKIYMYIYMVFKLIHCIKEHWWSLTLSWPDEVQRMVFDRPFVL